MRRRRWLTAPGGLDTRVTLLTGGSGQGAAARYCPRMERLGRLSLPLVAASLAFAVLAPVLFRRGFVLTGDMVFVPRMGWSPRLLGLDGTVPRSVPSDAVLAVLSRLLPADVVQHLVLALIVGGAAWGAGRLAESAGMGRLPVAASAVGFAWTPFLYERLVQGQWALLIGWATLPWAVAVAVRPSPVGTSALRAAAPTLAVMAIAALGGANAWLLVVPTALLVIALSPVPGRLRRCAWTAAGGLLLTLPWSLPSLLRPDGLVADPEGVRAFAARADIMLGSLGSLLSGGGIWNAFAAPPGRSGLLTGGLTLLWLGVVLVGLLLLGCVSPPWFPGLGVAAAGGLLLAVVGTVAPGQALFRLAESWIGGFALLRDGQKFVAPWTLLAALALGQAVQAAQLTTMARTRLIPYLLLLLPLVLVPSLAWGASGRIAAVSYPGGWTEAAQAVQAAPGPVLLLPWQSYRAFSWNADRPSLDPAARWFSSRVVGSDALVVDGRVVRGEDPVAARLESLADHPADLVTRASRLGVRWVLIERDTPGMWTLPEGHSVVDTPQLTLVQITPTAPFRDGSPPGWVVLCGWVLAGATAIGATALAFSPWLKR
jgi:hypothetical protein